MSAKKEEASKEVSERVRLHEQARKELARLREEERKAARRVGSGSADALDWLLAFVQTDLASLSEGQWIDLGAEMSAFAWGQVTGKALDERLRGIDAARWPTDKTKNYQPHLRGAQGLRPSKETINNLQCTIKDALNQLLEFPEHVKECSFPRIELRLSVSSTDPRAPTGEALSVSAGSAEDAFIFHAASALAKHVVNVKRCVECQTIFLGARSDQHFCSSRCLNKVMQRRLRERRTVKASGRMRRVKRK